MDSIAEIWKPIPGFEGKYEASSEGRIKSLDREITRPNRWGAETTVKWRGRILVAIENKDGYLQTKLGECKKPWGVHQLVAMAFHGYPPRGMTVDHIDTNKRNNRPENLEYVTAAENVRREWQSRKQVA